MDLRDRAVVAALLVALGGLSAVALVDRRPEAPVSAASPSPSPAPPRAYREGFVGQPTAVSPFGAVTAADRALVALTFAGLVRLGPDGFVPDLAAGWSVDPSGASYTFELRRDARWQDGEPVTAHDVAFTVGVLRDPAYTGPGGASWRDVTVTELGPTTVRFDLRDPIAGFLAAATQPIAPAHLLEGTAVAALATAPFGVAPIGNGPYRLLAWNSGEAFLEATAPEAAAPAMSATPTVDSIASAALPSPRAGLGLARIEFTFSEDPATLVAAYRRGALDAVSGLPPALAAELGSEPGSHLLRYPRTTLTAVVLDLRAGHTAFADARARRGLFEALDRDGIVATEMAGLAVRADSPVPSSYWAYQPPSGVPLGQDLVAAGKDLAAGGWRRVAGGWQRPGAKRVTPVRIACPDVASSPVSCAVADAVAADWRAVGLTVEVQRLPPAALVAKHLRTGDFDAAVLDIALGLDPDLYPLLASSQTVSGGSNVSGLQDPALDGRLAAARRPGPDATRLAAWQDLQTYLAARTFLLPIAFREEVVVARDELHGPTVRELGDGSERFWDVLTWRLADDR
ncbi:MAG TPA: ABC transporter substrate-binding protein [Candidatus Dormibacteraeota bacterium]|nr:ABC transporter substrate-binding protein [Candidatus Dormibacteraeota bacterium]